MLKEHTATAGTSRLRYWQGGTGSPVVHIHGAQGPRLTAAYDLLASHHQLTALQIPGYGGSWVDPALASTRDVAAAWAPVLRSIVTAPFALWGTSLGAKVALWLALDHPDLLNRLILESPAAIRPVDHSLLKFAPAELPARVYAHPELADDPPVDPAVARQQLDLALRLQGPNRDPELEGRLPELSVPTLVVFGERDGIVPPEMGREYVRLMPQAQLVFVWDTAHAVQRERPEAFCGLVEDFLSRGPALTMKRTSGALLN